MVAYIEPSEGKGDGDRYVQIFFFPIIKFINNSAKRYRKSRKFWIISDEDVMEAMQV